MLKLFKSISLIGLCVFLLTACSKRESHISSEEINNIYKPVNRNSGIKNSKAMHRATLRSYNVFGKWYYPKIVDVGDEFSGIASWYGADFHAKKTSNGEIYNMYAMTAAHKTLPMNTVVRVNNLENGKSIIVRINDRGPFVRGRIIDLSNVAAHKIDMVKKGTARVKITVLGYNGMIDNDNAPIGQLPKYNNSKAKINTYGRYSLQVGAFGSISGAKKVQNEYQSLTNKHDVIIKKVFSQGRFLHKVYIMGFSSHNQALNFRNSNGINAFIVKE